MAVDRLLYVPTAAVRRPVIGVALVPRPAVVRHLREAGNLVTLTAPAGYGKTAALLLWDDADVRPFAWAPLFACDQDETHLLLQLLAAVESVRGIRDDRRRAADAGGVQPADLTCEVIRALERAGPLVLVVDDAHHLVDPGAITALRAVIDAAPAATTVAVAGRFLLPLGVARRRLHGTVVEVGVDALRFSRRETATALAGSAPGVNPSAVHHLCEGWAAGVALTASALRDGAASDDVAGGRDAVVDYLVDEVLAGLDADAAGVLVEAALLDRFTAAELDTFLGRDDCARVLDDLTAAGGGFLVDVDGHRREFRFHRLVRTALCQRLHRRSPRRHHELLHRTIDVLERRGDTDGALLAAVDAGERAQAAAIVGRDAVHLGFDGRVDVLARRVALLDSRDFVEFPDAAIARAWLGVVTGDAGLISRSLLFAHQADTGDALADGTPSVRTAAALISSMVDTCGVHDVIRYADVVRSAGDHTVNPWWGAATVMKGSAEAMLGFASRARALLESAVPVVEDLPGFQAAALAHLALLDLTAGDDEGAIQRIDAARTLVVKYELRDLVHMVVVHAVDAVMAAHVEDREATYAAVRTTETLLSRLGHLAARTALLGHGLLAWTAAAIGDDTLLRVHLDAAERARRREPDTVALGQRVDRVRAMARGGSSPLTAAELRLLPLLATHLSLQQIAAGLVIGRETAKSQTAAIYRKLGVSSRAGAVDEARRTGLLER